MVKSTVFFLKNVSAGESYNNNEVVPGATPVINKAQDMRVQEMDAKAKELQTFTKKLADKDRIALV